MADEIQPPDAPGDASASLASVRPVTTQGVASFARPDLWSFAITTALAFMGYWFTLAPEVTLGDSGMYATGAMCAGVSSPPGCPLWTIYSWLFINLLPVSNIAWRVAVGSAVASATACGLVAMMGSWSGAVVFENTRMFADLKRSEQKWLRGFCGGIAGLVLAFSGALWGQAVVVNVRALSVLLFVCVLCLLMRWMFEARRRRFLFGAFFLFGLLLTNSQDLIVALPGLVCAIMLADGKVGRDVALFVLPLAALATAGFQYGVWILFPREINWPLLGALLAVTLTGIALAVKTRRIGTAWKSALLCGLGLLLGLALCFYLPIASMTNPPANWGYPRTVEGFFHVLGRGQFEHVRPTDDFGTFAKQLWIYLEIAGREFGWPGLVIALLPFVLMRRLNRVGRSWLLSLLAVFLGVGPLLLAMLNPLPNRQSAGLVTMYFAASYVVLGLWFGLGLMIVGARMTRPEDQASRGESLPNNPRLPAARRD